MQITTGTETALAAIQSSEEILAVVSDGPPSPEHVLRDLKKEIGGVRWGPTVEEKDRPGDPFALATTVCLGVWISQPTTSVTRDGAALFASGPHEIVPGSAERAVGQRLFNGLTGALLVDLGPRPRRLVQHGRLSAASAASSRPFVSTFPSIRIRPPQMVVSTAAWEIPKTRWPRTVASLRGVGGR